jgi:hypothetical protein
VSEGYAAKNAPTQEAGPEVGRRLFVWNDNLIEENFNGQHHYCPVK